MLSLVGALLCTLQAKIWSVRVACCELRDEQDPGETMLNILVPKQVLQKDFYLNARNHETVFYPRGIH
jgi:hypothetical protein